MCGLCERCLDVLSILRRSTPDLVNRKLLLRIGPIKHYLSENPYDYTLATNLDGLYATAQKFLGRSETTGTTSDRVPSVVIEQILDVVRAYRRDEARGLDDAGAAFRIALDNLQVFEYELYPIALRAMKAFYEYEDDSEEKTRRLYAFLELWDHRSRLGAAVVAVLRRTRVHECFAV